MPSNFFGNKKAIQFISQHLRWHCRKESKSIAHFNLTHKFALQLVICYVLEKCASNDYFLKFTELRRSDPKTTWNKKA
eukprot:557962-Amphidinium_carterae.1